MREQTGRFEGAKNCRLFYKIWQPDGVAKGVLVIIHGSGEHLGRYQNLIDALVPAGYVLAGYDQRGHGRSEGQRGHVDSYEQYRHDIHAFIGLATEVAQNLPLFLYGHSAGSLQALDYLIHFPAGMAGAIISGTALDPKDAAPPHLVWVARLLSGVKPNFSIKMKLEGQSLTRDPQAAAAYMQDPLVHWDRSVRWGTENLEAIARIKRRGSEIALPVLFIHGERDPLVAAAGAEEFFDGVRSDDKTIRIYPGGMHEPHNDVDYPRVMADICDWLDQHVVSAQLPPALQ